MKILHILNHIRNIGNGIVNVAIDLACIQASQGHHVAVASMGGDYETLLTKWGVKHFQLDQSRNPINLIQASFHYQNIIQTFQPDIVHAHMMTGIVLAWGLRFNRQKYGIVSTVHNEFQRSSILMGLADRVIAVSQAVGNLMAQRGVPEQKIRIISNGPLHSPRRRHLNEYEPLELHRPSIVTVAGMYQRKGILELIDAFTKIADHFPSTHLYIVGDGPDRTIFEHRAQQTSFSDRIHFEGFQPDPQRYLLSTDIFVLVSHKDPSPLVIPEAREAGCAIIASQVDGIPEALDEGKAGLLVPAKDVEALSQALTQVLSDETLLKEWKERSQIGLERLDIKRVALETTDVYKNLQS